MSESAARLAARLAPAADSGAQVDIHAELGLMTLAVVGTAAFGCVRWWAAELGQASERVSVSFLEGARTRHPPHPCSVDFRTLEGAAPAPQPGGATARALGRLQRTPSERLVAAVQAFFALFGLANPLFGCFFLFPELERLVKLAAALLPNAGFRQARGRAGGGRWRAGRRHASPHVRHLTGRLHRPCLTRRPLPFPYSFCRSWLPAASCAQWGRSWCSRRAAPWLAAAAQPQTAAAVPLPSSCSAPQR